jgi:hypothetical protein
MEIEEIKKYEEKLNSISYTKIYNKNYYILIDDVKYVININKCGIDEFSIYYYAVDLKANIELFTYNKRGGYSDYMYFLKMFEKIKRELKIKKRLLNESK